MYKENISGRLAFISGASAGIGEAVAKMLASNGVNLILTARRIDRLENLKNSLEKEYKIKFNYAELIFITLHIISKNLLIYNENQNFIIQNKMSVMVNEMIETIYNKLKIETIDERLTTVAAHKTVNNLDGKKNKKRDIVDTISAVYILETYINRNCNINN